MVRHINTLNLLLTSNLCIIRSVYNSRSDNVFTKWVLFSNPWWPSTPVPLFDSLRGHSQTVLSPVWCPSPAPILSRHNLQSLRKGVRLTRGVVLQTCRPFFLSLFGTCSYDKIDSIYYNILLLTTVIDGFNDSVLGIYHSRLGFPHTHVNNENCLTNFHQTTILKGVVEPLLPLLNERSLSIFLFHFTVFVCLRSKFVFLVKKKSEMGLQAKNT